MNEVILASAVVIAGTLIAVRASMDRGDETTIPAPPRPEDATPGTDGDILAEGDDGLGFTTVLEVRKPGHRLRRASRLALGLVLVGSALGLTIIVVVRGLAILWPSLFPTG